MHVCEVEYVSMYVCVYVSMSYTYVRKGGCLCMFMYLCVGTFAALYGSFAVLEVSWRFVYASSNMRARARA